MFFISLFWNFEINTSSESKLQLEVYNLYFVNRFDLTYDSWLDLKPNVTHPPLKLTQTAFLQYKQKIRSFVIKVGNLLADFVNGRAV